MFSWRPRKWALPDASRNDVGLGTHQQSVKVHLSSGGYYTSQHVLRMYSLFIQGYSPLLKALEPCW